MHYEVTLAQRLVHMLDFHSFNRLLATFYLREKIFQILTFILFLSFLSQFKKMPKNLDISAGGGMTTQNGSPWVLQYAQSLSRVQLFATPWTVSPPGSFVHGDSPGKNTGLGCHALLQGIFPPRDQTQSPQCKWILYQLSHQGSPRILEWVAYPFSKVSSQPRNQTGVFCVAGVFSTLSYQGSQSWWVLEG